MCDTIKYPYLLHWKSIEFLGGRGVYKAKHFKGKYAVELEFPEGRMGANETTIHGRGMDIF